MSQNKIDQVHLNDIISQISVQVHVLATTSNQTENSELIIMDCLDRILNLLVLIKEPIEIIDKYASSYDCCPEVPYNGFRSLLYLSEKYFSLILKNVIKYRDRKSIFFFNSVNYDKMFQNIRDLLGCVYFVLKIAEKIITTKMEESSVNNGERKSLFTEPDDPINKIIFEPDVFIDSTFYSDFLGFYVSKILKLSNII